MQTGRYGIAVALVAIVAALSDLGLNAVGVREISTSPLEERWRLAQELLGLRILLTICGVRADDRVAAVAYEATIAGGVALAGVGLLVQATQDNFAMPLVVELRLGWISAFELLRQVLNTVVILILVVLGAHLLPFLGASIPVGVVVLVATVRVVRGRRALRPVFDGHRWRALDEDGAPLRGRRGCGHALCPRVDPARLRAWRPRPSSATSPPRSVLSKS